MIEGEKSRSTSLWLLSWWKYFPPKHPQTIIINRGIGMETRANVKQPEITELNVRNTT